MALRFSWLNVWWPRKYCRPDGPDVISLYRPSFFQVVAFHQDTSGFAGIRLVPVPAVHPRGVKSPYTEQQSACPSDARTADRDVRWTYLAACSRSAAAPAGCRR